MVIKTTIAPKYEIAVMNLIHSSGLGALNPNTIVMSWPPSKKSYKFMLSLDFLIDWKDSENECVRFTNYIRLANNMQFHIIILKPDTAFDGFYKYI